MGSMITVDAAPATGPINVLSGGSRLGSVPPHRHANTPPMSVSRSLAPMLAALALTSCAAVFSGSRTRVLIDTVPQGAKFTSNIANVQGTTPAKLKLPNGKKVIFQFEAPEGYIHTNYTAKPRMSGWVAGNLLFPGIPGLIYDLIADNSKVHDDIVIPLERVQD